MRSHVPGAGRRRHYLTVMNENCEAPEMPVGAEMPTLIGACTRSARSGGEQGPRVRLLGSGTIFREVIAAADLLCGRTRELSQGRPLGLPELQTNWPATASMPSAGTCCVTGRTGRFRSQ